MTSPIKLPEKITRRLSKLQSEIDEILAGAEQLLITILPDPIQFRFENTANRDVLTSEERAKSVGFVTRYQHLPGDCRVTAVERDGGYEIENMDYLRHSLNEYRPLIQNQNDPVYYQAIHRLLKGMLRLKDSTKGTTIRAFDITHADVTDVLIRWLGEGTKAITFVRDSLEYGYLYNGILQHSDPDHSKRYVEDLTSGELNYIIWKHAHCLSFIKAMLRRYQFVLSFLTSPRPGSL